MNKIFTSLLLTVCLFTLGSHSLRAQSCGTGWKVVNPKENSNIPLNGIIYAHNKFVAVGDKGAVMTSPDGLEWTKENNLSSDYDWVNIFWNGQQFIAISKNADMMSSLDAVNWKVTEANKQFPVERVATNGKLFVSIGVESFDSMGNYITQSHVANSLDATEWTSSVFKNIELTDVAWTGDQFIITGNTLSRGNRIISNKGIVLTSSDGMNWVQQIFNDIRHLSTVASNGKEILLYGVNNQKQNILLVGNDGQKWDIKQQGEPVSGWDSQLLWDGKQFFLLGEGHVNTSLNGKQWEAHRLRSTMSIQGIASNGLNSVMVGNSFYNNSPSIMTLVKDASEWISPLSLGTHIDDITSNGELFIALDGKQQMSGFPGLEYNVLTSTDGINWIKSAELGMMDLAARVLHRRSSKSSLWANNQFYIFGEKNAWTSADGKHWKKHDITMEPAGLLRFDKVVWNGSKFLAINHQTPAGHVILTSVDGLQWTANPEIIPDIYDPNHRPGTLSDLIWADNQFVIAFNNRIITSPDGLIWTNHTITPPADGFSNTTFFKSIAYNGERYVAVGYSSANHFQEIIIYDSLDAIHWTKNVSKSPALRNHLNNIIWTGNEFLATGNRGIALTSSDGKEWLQHINPNGTITKFAIKGTDIIGTIDFPEELIVHNKCDDSLASNYSSFISDELSIRAVIDPAPDIGYLEAIWQQQGEEITSRGDRVIWGYFYANPADIEWGNPNNPDVFVKIWFDVSGRVDVNYFHVSVPTIHISTKFNNNTTFTRLDTTQRYASHSFNKDGTSQVETNQEDGVSPADYPILTPNLTGYPGTDNLTIGTLINTESAGIIEGTWQLGGQSTTARGDEVMWGHFYANPALVNWGSPNNPDVFVKVWLDVSGRIDVNYFHVSVPDIGVYSDYPANGVFDQQGITILNDRYTRHEFSQVIKVTQ